MHCIKSFRCKQYLVERTHLKIACSITVPLCRSQREIRVMITIVVVCVYVCVEATSKQMDESQRRSNRTENRLRFIDI